MSDERRLSDADVDRIANAVAARLRDETVDPKSTRAAGGGETADARNGGNRRLPPSQRRGESTQRDHSRNERVEPAGGRVRDDVVATRQRKDDARGIERLDEPRAVPDADRNTPDARSVEGDGAGVTFESTLDDEGRVAIPAEIVTELDVEPGSSVRLTVHRTE